MSLFFGAILRLHQRGDKGGGSTLFWLRHECRCEFEMKGKFQNSRSRDRVYTLRVVFVKHQRVNLMYILEVNPTFRIGEPYCRMLFWAKVIATVRGDDHRSQRSAFALEACRYQQFLLSLVSDELFQARKDTCQTKNCFTSNMPKQPPKI